METVETRIAMYLAEVADETMSKTVTLPMSRKDLASHLGTTPETVSRKLADFEDNGWIKPLNNRDIEIS